MKKAFKSFFSTLVIVAMVAACTAKTENTSEQDTVRTETASPADTTTSPADTTASPIPADTTNNK